MLNSEIKIKYFVFFFFFGTETCRILPDFRRSSDRGGDGVKSQDAKFDSLVGTAIRMKNS